MISILRRFGFVLLLASAATPAIAASSVTPSDLDAFPSYYAPYQGIRVHYKTLGSGATAVVFVHGWSCDLSVWASQIPVVSGRIRAIFVDLPGFGQSDKPDVAYTMDYLAGAVEAVMQEAGVKSAVLVGHSMGTPVIRQYYRKYPAKVAGLVAVDGPLRSFFTDSAQVAPLLARFEGADASANIGRMFDGMFGPAMTPERAASIKRIALATPPRVAASAMKGMLDLAVWKDDPITVPLMAVMAPNAGWTSDYVAYVKKLAPGARIEMMKETGHFVMIERAAEFNALLDDFLKGLRILR